MFERFAHTWSLYFLCICLNNVQKYPCFDWYNSLVLSAVLGQEIGRESRLFQLATCRKFKARGKHNVHITGFSFLFIARFLNPFKLPLPNYKFAIALLKLSKHFE
jgi:hypothetical protein